MRVYSYYDQLRRLSADEVYDGMLGFGMFSNTVPESLNSRSFLKYCKVNSKKLPQKSCCDWIRYRHTRNIDQFREFGIPNPFSYERLVYTIKDNWRDILDYFKKQTAQWKYKVSRIHIRKILTSKTIFQMNYGEATIGTNIPSRAVFNMNYKNFIEDDNPLPELLLGKKYLVKADISRCFPSIYTHSIEWAAVTKRVAKIRHNKSKVKKSKSNLKKSWDMLLDINLRNTTYGETHGVLIGPHSSNLISEIILTAIDNKMYEEGYRYIRYVDDYSCYVESLEKADDFINDLDSELQEYGLAINQKKIKIIELPEQSESNWTNKLTRFLLKQRLDYSDVKAFFDFAIETMKENDSNKAILLYALKILSKKKMNSNAKKYYIDFGFYLLSLYPYLVPYADELFLLNSEINRDKLQWLLSIIYRRGLEKRDYLTSVFALHYACKHSVRISFLDKNLLAHDISDADFDEILNSKDCLLMLFAWLYSQKNIISGIQDSYTAKLNGLSIRLRNQALEYVQDYNDFERNWVFVYQVLTEQEIPDKDLYYSYWRDLKKSKVSFIDPY